MNHEASRIWHRKRVQEKDENRRFATRQHVEMVESVKRGKRGTRESLLVQSEKESRVLLG